MPINETRKDFFFQFLNDPPDPSFKHTPAASKPAEPAFPSTLTAPQIIEVTTWRSARGAAKAALYASLSATAKAKADEYIAWDIARNAWEMADKTARQQQWAWFKADAAISNEPTVARSADSAGTGSGGPAVPQTHQLP